jgi:hypothetical protein
MMPRTFTLSDLTQKANKVTLMAARLQEARRRFQSDEVIPPGWDLVICPICMGIYKHPHPHCDCATGEKLL